MIIKQDKDFNSTYYVSSGEWESIVRSPSFDEAASLGLEEAFEEYGENLKLSPAILCLNLSNFFEKFGDHNSKIYSTTMVLSNIGKHDLAKKLKLILKKI